MNYDHDVKITTATGATSSKAPAFHLIPLGALIALAGRYEGGAVKHGPYNWKKGLGSDYTPPVPCKFRDYCIERLNHVVFHALKLMAKLQNLRPEDDDDDAGAIMWGGAFASEYRAKVQQGKDSEDSAIRSIQENLNAAQ
jgi:hypothetical protein